MPGDPKFTWVPWLPRPFEVGPEFGVKELEGEAMGAGEACAVPSISPPTPSHPALVSPGFWDEHVEGLFPVTRLCAGLGDTTWGEDQHPGYWAGIQSPPLTVGTSSGQRLSFPFHKMGTIVAPSRHTKQYLECGKAPDEYWL